MNKYRLRNFKINNKENISIYTNQNIFESNLTTRLLIEGCKKIIKKNYKILDLGCGSGVISNYFFKKKIINKIYSSDISKEAVDCARYNAQHIGASYDIRLVALLDKWEGNKFDLIINDISGISNKMNSLTNWYNSAPNESGVDGTNFTLKILKKYRNYLKKNGKLIFPIIGLSNKKKIFQFMKKQSIKYKMIASQDWPLPKELYKRKVLLNKLKKKNIINYDERFNILITNTEIFCCK